MEPRGQETFRVGFVLFVALLILVIGVVLIGSDTLEGGRVRYLAYFDDVGGLNPGAHVYLGGVKAGKVESVEFARSSDHGAIEVVLSIDVDKQDRVYQDCVVRIETEGLLGEKLVSVTSGSPESGRVPVGEVLRSERIPFLSGMVAKGEQVVAEVSSLLDVLRRVLERIESGDGTLSRLIKDPTLHQRLDEGLEEATALAQEYRRLGRDLQQSVRNVEGTLADTTARLGTRGDQLLVELQSTVERVGGRVEAAVEEVTDLSQEIRRGEGTLARLLQDDSLYVQLEVSVQKVGQAAEKLAGILEEVAEGDGTLSSLIKDRTVITSLEDIISGVRESGLIVNLIGRAERKGRELRIERALDEKKQDSSP